MQRRHERPLRRVNPSGKTVWVARYTGRDGKRRSAGSFEKRGACKEPLADGSCCAQHAIDEAYKRDGQRAPSSRKTVRAWAKQWTRVFPRSDRTNATNEHRVSRVLDVDLEGYPFGDWPLMELRPKHGPLLLDVLLVEQGRSAAGAKNILLTLSAMMQDAIKMEEAITNPFIGVKVRASDPRATKPAREPRIVLWEDSHRLAAAAGEYEAMVRVMSDCGVRLGELLGLYRTDLKLGGCDECDVAVSHFHVRRTAHAGRIMDGTKRERMRQVFEGGRVVPIPHGLEPLLRAMPRRIDTPLLFPTPKGMVWLEDNLRRDVVKPARKASGVDAGPQDLRHSWISQMRALGVDPADLAAMAGHSVLTASSVYTHALRRSYEDVASAI